MLNKCVMNGVCAFVYKGSLHIGKLGNYWAFKRGDLRVWLCPQELEGILGDSKSA